MPMTVAYTPGTQIDHYEIIRLLGHGGMNRVYLARDLHNQQQVVLKFPSADLIGNIAVFERYKRESEIGNRIDHPYIQHVLNSDEKRSDEETRGPGATIWIYRDSRCAVHMFDDKVEFIA